MSRQLRLHIPGALYHVTSRGNNKQCIFTDDTDHRRFLQLLARVLGRFRVDCLAFCLLWNHYHLLICAGELPISRMMQQLNSTYCQWFNRRHGRVGHVVQGPFKASLIDSETYLLTALRYIVLNPVVARLVKHPEEWRWSSYRATAGLDAAPDFLSLDRIWTALDTNDPREGQQRFAAFVSSAEVDEALFKLFVVASRTFARRVAPLLEPYRDVRDFVYAERFAARPPLEDLFTDCSSLASRQSAVWDAFSTHAYTLSEIGRVAGCAPSTAWAWVKRENARRQQLQLAVQAPEGIRSRSSISGFE